MGCNNRWVEQDKATREQKIWMVALRMKPRGSTTLLLLKEHGQQVKENMVQFDIRAFQNFSTLLQCKEGEISVHQALLRQIYMWVTYWWDTNFSLSVVK